MPGILPLRNPIQHYDWGSKSAIPDFLGRAPSEEPMAEMWLGAHPKAPSEVLVDDHWLPLNLAIQQNPAAWLGDAAARTGAPGLPFLFKILAAGKPLSIQAHPDREQAREGFEREQAAEIPLLHARRNYRDRNHKPEVIYAVTPFTVVCGFRNVPRIVELLEQFQILDSLPGARHLHAGDLRAFFAELLTAEIARLADSLETALAMASELRGPEAHWMLRMAEEFPDDRGIFAPLFLNLETLEPGQAMYTGPGILHAYLDGLGIELMANSDNVLRGGCTSKHVDPDELLRIVRFEAAPAHRVSAHQVRPGVEVFPSPAEEFELSKLEIRQDQPFSSIHTRAAGAQILLCVAGNGEIHSPGHAPIAFTRDTSFIVPASVSDYRIQGHGTFFHAQVGRSAPSS